jgi:hypothetical protein
MSSMASAIAKAKSDRRRSMQRHLVLASTLGTAAAGAGLATVVVTPMRCAVAAIYFPWLSRRERAALAVRAELRQRLGEFRSGRNWNAG